MAIFKRHKNENQHGNFANVDRKTKKRLKREQKERNKSLYVRQYPLRNAVPRQGYTFHSNYFEYGNRVGRILTLVEPAQEDRARGAMWHFALIPKADILNDLPKETDESAVHGAHGQLFEMMENKSKHWTTSRQYASSRILKQQRKLIDDDVDLSKLSVRHQDVLEINDDLGQGDMYASIASKVLITARNLRDLDVACNRYARHIKDSFDGIHFEVFEGQQEADLEHLLLTADQELGGKNHPMATSSAYAGGYDILTRGITDPNGEYIGRMVGDINNTAVLLDVDRYDDQVVIAHSAKAETLNLKSYDFDAGTRSTTLLGVLLAQGALINNHRVIHFVLNGSKPQNIGADLSSLTTVVPLNEGSINPFEIFGDFDDDLGALAAQREKLELMAKLISPSIDDVDLNEMFANVLQQFYEDDDLLVPNAEQNRDRLRLVGLPHDQYPLLQEFERYLQAQMDHAEQDNRKAQYTRYERLHSAFNKMRKNGQIFNVETSELLDMSSISPQIVYDLSSIANRGKSVVMAQFVNAFRYATDSLNARDVVMIHGTDELDDAVKPYVTDVLKQLRKRDIRVVFLYDDAKSCLNDADFNRLNDSDYTMLGGLNNKLVDKYQGILGQPMSSVLAAQIEQFSNNRQYGNMVYYLSRGVDNIIFALDISLGIRRRLGSGKNAIGLVSEHPVGLSTNSAKSKNELTGGERE